MEVKVLSHTPDPINVIYKACRTCYSAVGPIGLKEQPYDKMITLIERVTKSGHHSVLEHVSVTFAIEGVSRALTHQLVRHRLASFSQQSQRYVNYAKNGQDTAVDYIVPKTIKKDEEALALYNEMLDRVSDTYKQLVDLGIPAEDARYLLPNATETKIVMTMNFRELLSVSSVRLCSKAQWEIVKMFGAIKKEVSGIDKFLGNFLQPKCQHMGYCNEKEPCGIYSFK